jgi:hypothetical protein
MKYEGRGFLGNKPAKNGFCTTAQVGNKIPGSKRVALAGSSPATSTEKI